jgi:hypothetical protein
LLRKSKKTRIFLRKYYWKLHLPLLPSHRYPISLFWKLTGDYQQRHRKVIPIHSWICLSDLIEALDPFSGPGSEQNRSSEQTEQSCVVCFQFITIQSFRKLHRINVSQSLPVNCYRDNHEHLNVIRSGMTSSQNISAPQKLWHFITLRKCMGRFKCLSLWNGG